MSTIAALYDQDFYLWLMKNAELLKQGKFLEVDREHMVEELEAMGKSEQRELLNRLAVLLAHLLKWKFQPEKRSNTWIGTIVEQRVQIMQLFEDSPSLKHDFESRLGRAYMLAVAIASKEMNLAKTCFPSECPFSTEQVFDEDFFGTV